MLAQGSCIKGSILLGTGLQYALPATWAGMSARKLPPQLLSRWFSSFPAKLAGLAPSKGAIAEGADADFVVSMHCQLIGI